MKEMLKVLNCGIGMILIISKKDSKSIIEDLERLKMKAQIIGSIIEKKGKQKFST